MHRRMVWARRQRGATAVEYALLVALMAAVIVVAVLTLGQRVSGMFASVPPF